MKAQEFQEIVNFIYKSPRKGVIYSLMKKFPDVSKSTLFAVYCQEYQKKTKKSYYWHFNPESAAKYYSSYLEMIKDRKSPGVLIDLADKLDLSPSLMAKIMIEQFSAHQSNDNALPSKHVVTKMLRDTSLISEPRLAVEVHMCVLEDDNYGPVADAIKQSIGHEYECRLKREVRSLGIPYLDEDELRRKGYDKTPDVKLEIPIAIDGKVCNWIESKALFGDEENHNGYLKDQLWSYWNRFGSGLVIYWLGFIDEVNVHVDKGIMLSDHLPDASRITYLQPLNNIT